MNAAAIPGALVVTALTVPVACGAEPAQPSGVGESSARFSDVTNYVVEGEKRDEVITGAFDWVKREGWTRNTYGEWPSGSWRQVRDECFSRDADEDWKHWHLQGGALFCDPDRFQPPQEVLEALRSYGSLESVGQEEIHGVSTTHYRVVPTDESDDPEQWLEIWLDKGETVYRLQRPAGESSPRIREYFDFGTDVHVTPPCRFVPETSSSSTTLTQDKGKSTWCIEETG